MQLSPFRWEHSKPLVVSFLFTLRRLVDFSLRHIPVGSFKRLLKSFSQRSLLFCLTVSQNWVRTRWGHVCWCDAHCETWLLLPLCSPWTLPMVSRKYLLCVFPLQIELSLIQMIFFFLVLYFFFSFCIIDYLQFLVTYMSGKSLEDNQVKCESPLLTKPLGYIVLL